MATRALPQYIIVPSDAKAPLTTDITGIYGREICTAATEVWHVDRIHIKCAGHMKGVITSTINRHVQFRDDVSEKDTVITIDDTVLPGTCWNMRFEFDMLDLTDDMCIEILVTLFDGTHAILAVDAVERNQKLHARHFISHDTACITAAWLSNMGIH